EQIEGSKNLEAELQKLKDTLSSIQSKAITGDQNQIELASTVSRLERQIADIQQAINLQPPSN
ncbi:MAG: hypothetical protein KJO69_05140, partial [Gammaproteobacteria bacterium]|nr:hypothetical protein [Gammaproteobacteria bacterium]